MGGAGSNKLERGWLFNNWCLKCDEFKCEQCDSIDKKNEVRKDEEKFIRISGGSKGIKCKIMKGKKKHMFHDVERCMHNW